MKQKLSINTIGIIAKKTVAENHARELMELVHFVSKKKKRVIVEESIAALIPVKAIQTLDLPNLVRSCDLLIVMGGDGTLLKTAAHLGSRSKGPGPLLLGVNLGNLGFLLELRLPELQEGLSTIFQGQASLDRRRLLEITIHRKGKKKRYFALNDAVINQGGFARLVELSITREAEKILTFRGDGLIVSSPTGSTGHSLSAGGPVVHPALPAFVVTPLCPASLSLRPIVIPDDSSLSVEIRRAQQPIMLTMDGQVTVALDNTDRVEIKRSAKTCNLLRLQDGKGYFDTLKEKLGWGGNNGQ